MQCAMALINQTDSKRAPAGAECLICRRTANLRSQQEKCKSSSISDEQGAGSEEEAFDTFSNVISCSDIQQDVPIRWALVRDNLQFCNECLEVITNLTTLQGILDKTKKSIEEKINWIRRKVQDTDTEKEIEIEDDECLPLIDKDPLASEPEPEVSERLKSAGPSRVQPKQPWRFKTDSEELIPLSNRVTFNLVSSLQAKAARERQRVQKDKVEPLSSQRTGSTLVERFHAKIRETRQRVQKENDNVNVFIASKAGKKTVKTLINSLQDEARDEPQNDFHNNEEEFLPSLSPSGPTLVLVDNLNSQIQQRHKGSSNTTVVIQCIEKKAINDEAQHQKIEHFEDEITADIKVEADEALNEWADATSDVDYDGISVKDYEIKPLQQECSHDVKDNNYDGINGKVEADIFDDNSHSLKVTKIPSRKRRSNNLKTYVNKSVNLEEKLLLKHGINKEVQIVLIDFRNPSGQNQKDKKFRTRSGRTVKSIKSVKTSEDENDSDFDPRVSISDNDDSDRNSEEGSSGEADEDDGNSDLEKEYISSPSKGTKKLKSLKYRTHESELKKSDVICYVNHVKKKRRQSLAIFNKAVLKSKVDGMVHFKGIQIKEDGNYLRCGGIDCEFYVDKVGDDISKSYQQMANHISEHRGKVVHQCRDCELFFRSRKRFECHNHEFHPELQDKMICPICERPFKYLSDVEMHKWSHYNEEEIVAMEAEGKQDPRKIVTDKDPLYNITLKRTHECKICKLRFIKEKSLKHHLKKYHSANKQKEESKEQCSTKSSNTEFLKPVPSDRIACITEESEMTKSTVVIYIDVLYNNIGRVPAIYNRAVLESKVTGSKYFRGTEIKEDPQSNVMRCGHCKCDFNLIKTDSESDIKELYLQMANHIISHGGRIVWQCRTCELFFKSRKNYNDHISSYHPDLPLKGGTKCPICEKPCSPSFLQQHKWSHYNVYEIAELEAAGKVDPRKKVKEYKNTWHKTQRTSSTHVCSICDQRFLSDKQLRVHFSKRHPSEPRPKETFMCEFCGEVIRSLSAYNNHKRSSHPGGVSFRYRRCELCNTEVKKKGFQAHMRKFHGAAKPFKCDKCSKEFACRNAFKYHVECYCDMKPKILKCKYCPKTCNHPKTFRNHMLQFHREKIKPKEGKPGPPKVKLPLITCRRKFPCPLCPVEKVFHRPSLLQDHVKRFHSTHFIEGLLTFPTDEEVKEPYFLYVTNSNQSQSNNEERKDDYHSSSSSDQEEDLKEEIFPVKRKLSARRTRGKMPKRFRNELGEAVNSILPDDENIDDSD